jgi:transketolase
MLRAVQGSTVLYPCDATSAAALVMEMAERQGVVYMRTTRGAYPVLYESSEAFPVGGSKLLRSSEDDQVALIGGGVTVHECLAAADALAAEGVRARVLDMYSVKPPDAPTLLAAARETGRLVVAEDHHPEGGLASAVLEVLAEAGRIEVSLASLAVRELPGSGTRDELLAAAGISAEHIATAARSLVAGAGKG